ncbi:MAG: hypothetical protein ACKO1I_07640, partial [Microcystis aeruginosa]
AATSFVRRETHHNRSGDLVHTFSINPRTCRVCSLKERYLANGSAIHSGRRVSVTCRKLPSHEGESQAGGEICPDTPPEPPSSESPGNHPVFWLDLPVCQLRY